MKQWQGNNETNNGKQSGENSVKVKLTKLKIKKIEGTNLDRLRFCSQSDTEIDRADITTVSKFSYLKELVIPKVLTDGLPFNTAAYERAKTIFKAKFGKPSEVTNACIMSLPTIIQSSVGKNLDFYEKLVTHSQASDTMGKLKEIYGYVRLTLNKLPTSHTDLVRTDDSWQEWDFCKSK